MLELKLKLIEKWVKKMGYSFRHILFCELLKFYLKTQPNYTKALFDSYNEGINKK